MFYTRSEKAVHCGEPKRSERGHTETGQYQHKTCIVLCATRSEGRLLYGAAFRSQQVHWGYMVQHNTQIDLISIEVGNVYLGQLVIREE